MWRFEARLAWRHLVAGRGQTVLIIAGIAMAVTLVVFVSGLIYGLQRRLIDTILGSIAQVTVKVPEPAPRAPAREDGAEVIAKTTRRALQRKGLEQWQALEQEFAALPHVRAVAPEVIGQAIINSAGTDEAVVVYGVIPSLQDRITHITDNMIAGDFLQLSLGEAIVDYELAGKLGVGLGDRVRLASGDGQTVSLRVSGIFFAQRGLGGGSTVYVPLRTAQFLFDTGTAVTDFAISLDELFQANAVADHLQASFPVKADSWMRDIPQLMLAFRAQSATALLIAAFSLTAAGFAIASVLIVSVLKRSREIGILKAMGARSRQVLVVFILEGLGIAVLGSLAGALGGAGLIIGVRQILQPAQAPGIAREPLLPGVVSPWIVLVTVLAAILITVIASVLPARSAARLNPVEVIQRG